MRVIRLALPAAVILLVTSATVQAQTIAPPSLLYAGTPTARSWGMGFAEMASITGAPSAASPATLGLYALSSPGLAQTHNWERLSSGSTEEIGFANNVQFVAWNLWSGKALQRAPQIGFGVMHHSGWYTWTSPYEIFRPRTHIERWAFGVGVNLGFDVGFGLAYRQHRYTYPPGVGGSYMSESDWQTESSLGAQLRLNNWAQRWGVIDDPLTIHGITPEIFVGGAIQAEEFGSERAGISFGASMTRENLPVVSIERVIDYVTGNNYRFECTPSVQIANGWELALAGAVFIRRGELGTDYRNVDFCPPSYRWRTHGYAVDVGGAQRWVRELLDIRTSPTLGWILDHVELRYETASFRDSGEVPSGLGNVSIHQWSIGLIDVGRL